MAVADRHYRLHHSLVRICIISLVAGAAWISQANAQVAPDKGQLTPREEILLTCATSDELLKIQAYQRAIEGFQRLLDALWQPYDDAVADAVKAQQEADAAKPDIPADQAEPAGTDTHTQTDDRPAQLRDKAAKIWKAIMPRQDELIDHIDENEKGLRQILRDIESRGPCPPLVKTRPVKEGPGLPVPSQPFVMPTLPPCFNDDKERDSMDDTLYELMLEQINASSLASSPESRATARANADALADLRHQVFAVPFCPAKSTGNHALRSLLGHVTIGVGESDDGNHSDTGPAKPPKTDTKTPGD